MVSGIAGGLASANLAVDRVTVTTTAIAGLAGGNSAQALRHINSAVAISNLVDRHLVSLSHLLVAFGLMCQSVINCVSATSTAAISSLVCGCLTLEAYLLSASWLLYQSDCRLRHCHLNCSHMWFPRLSSRASLAVPAWLLTALLSSRPQVPQQVAVGPVVTCISDVAMCCHLYLKCSYVWSSRWAKCLCAASLLSCLLMQSTGCSCQHRFSCSHV